jgi:hypothetical protein
MTSALGAAGRAAARAFVAALVTYGLGILAAPSLNRTVLLGVAALGAALVAFIRFLQAYIPKLDLTTYIGSPFGDWADSFLQAFVASLVVTLPGIFGAPDLTTGKSLAVAAIFGALTAGARAVQGLLTVGEVPSPAIGVASPPNSYTYQGPEARNQYEATAPPRT